MNKYGTFTFTPPHEMTNWEAKSLIHVANYGAYGSYNEQWKRIEWDVRWSNRKFISIAQLLYILHGVLLPFNDGRYTKGWRSIDDFEERDRPFAKHTCPVELYVRPPVDFTEEECKKSLELGQANKKHIDWILEQRKISDWVIVFNCLKADPIEWVDVEIEIKNTTKSEAIGRATELIEMQKHHYEQFVRCYEVGGTINDS